MKKSFLLLILPLASACSRLPDTTTIGALTLPVNQHAGERISIKYTPGNNKIESDKDLQATLYYTVKNKLYAEPVALTDSGNPVKFSIILPDSAQAFAFRFQRQHTVINERNRYVFPIYNHTGKPVAGALAGMSLFYNDIGSSLLDLSPDKDTALKLMQADFNAHPEIKHKWIHQYLSTLLAVKKDSAYNEIQTALQQMLSSDSVKPGDYATAYDLYIQMEMWNKADSMMTAGPRKFPKGLMAMKAALNRFYSLRSVSIDSLIAHYQQFKQKFPVTDNQSAAAIQDEMLGTIASQYSDSGNYLKYIDFMSRIKSPLQKARAYNFLATRLTKAGKDIPFADSISKMSLILAKHSMYHPGNEKHSYQTDSDWKEKIQHVYAGYADDYAQLLNKERKTKDALAYEKQAVNYWDGENLFMNEHYIQYLLDTKDYKNVRIQLEKFITDGNTTDKLDAYLKQVYVFLNHSDEGYADYHRKLDEKAYTKLKNDLAKEIIDEPARDFTLPDLNGKHVSLAALKGKVVVLDFWATWCGPCRASMPGMQKVVARFKSDTNVVFLFVNTWERTTAKQRHKEVTKFITNHDYTFRILLDKRKADDSTQYQIVSNYNVDGIPTKFVIDPNGNIRFKKIGFSYSTPTEIREVSMMIKMVDR